MRTAKYNKQGDWIMRVVAYRAGIHGMEELAERAGIPYTKL